MNAPLFICPSCDGAGSWEGAPCDDCAGRGKVSRTIHFAVADLTNPAAEPFAVCRIDVSKQIGDGVEAIVDSLFWSREVAQATADKLNAVFGREVYHA